MKTIRHTLIAAAALGALIGGFATAEINRGTSPEPEAQPAAHTSNEAIIDGLFAAFNAHDVKALARFYAEDAVVYSPESCTPAVGADAIAASYAEMFAHIPDVHDALEVVVSEGNRAAVIFTASSQIPGAEFELPISAFLTFEDGKIIEDRVFFDTDIVLDCA
ncbi:MAG: nuclear transport factor 2 family protein [Pseudomonadota bacterium]